MFRPPYNRCSQRLFNFRARTDQTGDGFDDAITWHYQEWTHMHQSSAVTGVERRSNGMRRERTGGRRTRGREEFRVKGRRYWRWFRKETYRSESNGKYWDHNTYKQIARAAAMSTDHLAYGVCPIVDTSRQKNMYCTLTCHKNRFSLALEPHP